MNPLKEMQRVLLVGLRDELVQKGWTLERDNENGGTLVLTGDGMCVVASLHVYEDKRLVEAPAEAGNTKAADDECLCDAIMACPLHFEPAMVSVTEHIDKDGGQIWYGAECENHGALMNGDWFDLTVATEAVEAHRKEHA